MSRQLRIRKLSPGANGHVGVWSHRKPAINSPSKLGCWGVFSGVGMSGKATPPVPFQVCRFSSTPVGSDPFGKFSTLLDFSMAYKANDLTRSDLICPVLTIEHYSFTTAFSNRRTQAPRFDDVVALCAKSETRFLGRRCGSRIEPADSILSRCSSA